MKTAIISFIAGLIVGLCACLYVQDSRQKDLASKVEMHQRLEDAAKLEAEQYRNIAIQMDKRSHEIEDAEKPVRERIIKVKEVIAASGHIEPPDMASLVVEQDNLIKMQDDQIAALKDGIRARDGQIKSLEDALRAADTKARIQAEASKAALDGLKCSRWIDRSAGFACGFVISYGVRR